jgi:pyruvate dehydrogenase E1 component alpha subunit
MDRAAVDGMDVIATYRAVTEAIDRARTNCTPTMLEARTYRFRGHSMSDPGTYRTKDEVEEYKKSDPIITFGADLIQFGILTQERIDAMDDEIKHAVQEAVDFAESSPEPPLEMLSKYVYA